MLKERAPAIKERLQDCSLDGLSASDGWLDGWKTAYAIKERQIFGESGDFSEETITSCTDRLQEQRFTIVFFVNAAGENVEEPDAIWKSGMPRCFRGKLNGKLLFEQILFLDNAICHLESMVDSFPQIKIIFLPKSTTSRLQPLDAGIIQNLKVKYRKRLVKYVLARINENSSATRIIVDVNILMAIQWTQEAWKEVTGTTIKNYFEKCGVVKSNGDLMEIQEDDLESEALVRELSLDMSAAEYLYFDADIPTSEPMINEYEVDWRERLREDCINAITTQSNVSKETKKISDDDDDVEEEDVIQEGVSFVESLAMLDKIKKCSFLDDKSQMMLPTLTRKSEDLQIKIKNKSR